MKPFNNLPCINMAAVMRLHQLSSCCLKHTFIEELYQQAYLGRRQRVKHFLKKMTYPKMEWGFCFVSQKKYVFLLIKCRYQFWFNSLQRHQLYTPAIYIKQIRRTHSGLLPKGLGCACILRTTKCTFDTPD